MGDDGFVLDVVIDRLPSGNFNMLNERGYLICRVVDGSKLAEFIEKQFENKTGLIYSNYATEETMSCHHCGNATQPMAGPQYFTNNGEVLCFECWKPEFLAWLEANREAIEAEVMKLLLPRLVPVSSEIPDGVTVFYYPVIPSSDCPPPTSG